MSRLIDWFCGLRLSWRVPETTPAPAAPPAPKRRDCGMAVVTAADLRDCPCGCGRVVLALMAAGGSVGTFSLSREVAEHLGDQALGMAMSRALSA